MSRIDEIRARCEAATRGPWTSTTQRGWEKGVGAVHMGGCVYKLYNADDVEFIAHAREDIPYLLHALDVAEKSCPNGGNDGYITPRPCQLANCEECSAEHEAIAADIELDRDREFAEAVNRILSTPVAVKESMTLERPEQYAALQQKLRELDRRIDRLERIDQYMRKLRRKLRRKRR